MKSISMNFLMPLISLIPISLFAQTPLANEKLAVFVFSRTNGHYHESIPFAITAIKKLGSERGWEVASSDDANTIHKTNLMKYDVVVFNSTWGNIFNDAQRTALQDYIKEGGNFVGIHSAADTEKGWAWYVNMTGGAHYQGHLGYATGTITVEDFVHPSTKGLPKQWTLHNEWWQYQINVRVKSNVHVLSTLAKGVVLKEGNVSKEVKEEVPNSWCLYNEGKSRAWYTQVGHYGEQFSDPMILSHLTGGIEWAGGKIAADGKCGEPVSPTSTFGIGRKGYAESTRFTIQNSGGHAFTLTSTPSNAAIAYSIEVFNAQGKLSAKYSGKGAANHSFTGPGGLYWVRFHQGKSARIEKASLSF